MKLNLHTIGPHDTLNRAFGINDDEATAIKMAVMGAHKSSNMRTEWIEKVLAVDDTIEILAYKMYEIGRWSGMIEVDTEEEE